MSEQVLHGLIQQALKAHEQSRAWVVVGDDGAIWKHMGGGSYIKVGWIKDEELANALRFSQVPQEQI
ncbi:hypothetical protein [Phenylobacterium sp. J367]|uniref:hypothetical protein n=1 Tax=Phenylobacterium sp. J367 TaxID=2898435 RepID=UPI002150F888|nr:hypothetical protein [Phenylobacterium sp. J367]MCR5876945.1 hypothetical protein [Phenylobacterium sp. J367]MCR5877012.1 hypothetical protein [Phenylobacterium sp. J367]